MPRQYRSKKRSYKHKSMKFRGVNHMRSDNTRGGGKKSKKMRGGHGRSTYEL